MSKLTDTEIEAKVETLRRSVAQWLKQNELDHDVMFKTYVEHFDDNPGNIPLVMCITDAVAGALVSDLQTQFIDLVRSFSFYYEHETASVISFFPDNERESEQFKDYLAFRYFMDLLAPEFTDIYTEIFHYFSRHPSRLENLTWRGFEELVASVFKNQGFRTELGRGWADEGIDIRLLEHSVHGELSTLVQVKKYRKDRPIRIESIAALSGHLYDRGADKGIFVTTSRYLPSARRFAARQEKSIVLADTGDLAEWCQEISKRIGGTPFEAEFREILSAITRGTKFPFPIGEIFHASIGVTCIMNSFAVVVRATPRAALLVELPAIKTPASEYPYIGYEVPDLTTVKSELQVIKAKRTEYLDRIAFWGQQQLYTLWDGKPVWYDWND
jgi:hypothetical protein